MEEFKENFIKAWIDSGGLITKTVAGKLADLSPSEINRKVKLGVIKSYKMPNQNTVFVGFSEIMSLKRTRKKTEHKEKNV